MGSLRSSSGVASHPSGSYITAPTSGEMAPESRSEENFAQLAHARPTVLPGHPPSATLVGLATTARVVSGSIALIASMEPFVITHHWPGRCASGPASMSVREVIKRW